MIMITVKNKKKKGEGEEKRSGKEEFSATI